MIDFVRKLSCGLVVAFMVLAALVAVTAGVVAAELYDYDSAGFAYDSEVQLLLTAGAALETAPSVLTSLRMVESPHRTIRAAAGLVAPSGLVDDLGSVCLRSFSGDTEVLMADGAMTAIAEVRVGDEVWAMDPETGEAGNRTVIAIWPHEDTLIDFTVDGGSITTTEDHELWNATDHEWQETRDIEPGDFLLTADGQHVKAGNLDWTSAHRADAFDLTVEGLHTYFVSAGDQDVLVHNCGKWLSIDEFAQDVIRDTRNQYRGVSTATETGRHGSGLRAAARDLREQVANNGYLPEVNEQLIAAANRFEARARGIDHPGGRR